MLYTIKHNKNYTSTASTYQQYLGIVNRETLLNLAQTLGIPGVAKTHAKEKASMRSESSRLAEYLEKGIVK